MFLKKNLKFVSALVLSTFLFLFLENEIKENYLNDEDYSFTKNEIIITAEEEIWPFAEEEIWP